MWARCGLGAGAGQESGCGLWVVGTVLLEGPSIAKVVHGCEQVCGLGVG